MADSNLRFYGDEEADQILRLAASMSPPADLLSHENLLQTAAELGIAPEAVEAAAAEVSAKRQEEALRAEFQNWQRQRFLEGLAPMGVALAILVLINLSGSSDHRFAGWVVVGFVLVLAAKFRATFFRAGEHYQADYLDWKAARVSGESLENQDALFGISRRGRLLAGFRNGCRRRSRRMGQSLNDSGK